MKTLTNEQIIEAVSNVKNGCITRITYKTELPIKAEFKKQGYKIVKIVETSVRFGVDYFNIGSVVERKAKEAEEGKVPVVRKNPYEWIIDNKVKHHIEKDRYYVVAANLNGGHNTKSKYVLIGSAIGNLDMGDEIDPHYTHIVLDSYFKKSSSGGEVRTIAFENIIRINDLGTKVDF